MPTDFDIFRAISSTRFLNARFFVHSDSQEFNIIRFFSIIAFLILTLVKSYYFLFKNIKYFLLSALIQIQLDVSQLLRSLGS